MKDSQVYIVNRDPNQYVGIPYKPGGRDMNGLDCWGLVLLFFREQLAITLPDWEKSLNDIKQMTTGRDDLLKQGQAVELIKPKNYAIVLQSRGPMAMHAGVYHQGGIIHVGKNANPSRWDHPKYFGHFRSYQWQP